MVTFRPCEKQLTKTTRPLNLKSGVTGPISVRSSTDRLSLPHHGNQ
jgi:hypothetical protein